MGLERRSGVPGWGQQGRAETLASPDGGQSKAHEALRPPCFLHPNLWSRRRPPKDRFQGSPYPHLSGFLGEMSKGAWQSMVLKATATELLPGTPCIAESPGELSKPCRLDPTPEHLTTLVWGESWAPQTFKSSQMMLTGSHSSDGSPPPPSQAYKRTLGCGFLSTSVLPAQHDIPAQEECPPSERGPLAFCAP